MGGFTCIFLCYYFFRIPSNHKNVIHFYKKIFHTSIRAFPLFSLPSLVTRQQRIKISATKYQHTIIFTKKADEKYYFVRIKLPAIFFKWKLYFRVKTREKEANRKDKWKFGNRPLFLGHTNLRAVDLVIKTSLKDVWLIAHAEPSELSMSRNRKCSETFFQTSFAS